MKWLAVLGVGLGLISSASAESGRAESNGVVYQTFIANPKKISLYWLNPDGKPFHQLSALQRFLDEQSFRVEFLMNAGIFEPGGIPSGLLVIQNQILRPLNLASGKGNFFLQPNGVFWVDERGAHIASSSEYARRTAIPRLAIQSGPLLLQAGKTHSAFQKGSTNFLHRNGVGVRADGSVLFAITNLDSPRFPNLFEFAEFFRSQGCRDALFLDGDISQSATHPTKPLVPGNHFAAIFAVTE